MVRTLCLSTVCILLAACAASPQPRKPAHAVARPAAAAKSTPATPPTVAASDKADAVSAPGAIVAQERKEQVAVPDPRLAWWREARFGMFIHWGLYSILAGKWQGKGTYGEWIRHSAKIPEEQYRPLVKRFHPRAFDGQDWASLAREAGMKYIVITTKHHDGFALFPAKAGEFNLEAAPEKRDLLRELADAARAEGLRMGWYYSIMDWDHPDYLPRRDWEKRAATGAQFDRYYEYMKQHLHQLLTDYGDIAVLWFDGQWEHTWTREHGEGLYAFVRALQPQIVVNNRVSVGRQGSGMTAAGHAGDFGTPEQTVPRHAVTGQDWESCITMNRHWGFVRSDRKWKSTESLLRLLAETSSKGGNLLLNVGPTPEGRIPAASVRRLKAMGRWLGRRGDSIYGSQACPFPAREWGVCTQKKLDNGDTRLYLHVFKWPKHKLDLPGLQNVAKSARLLGGKHRGFKLGREGAALRIQLTPRATKGGHEVIALDLQGPLELYASPVIEADFDQFLESTEFRVVPPARGELRYTLDGTTPQASSPHLGRQPVRITSTTTVHVQLFDGERPLSPVASRTLTKVPPTPAQDVVGKRPGVQVALYEGTWQRVPDFAGLKPVRQWVAGQVAVPGELKDHFGLQYSGWVEVPLDGMYRFFLRSDDGSKLWIGTKLVVDNDGLHSALEQSGDMPLAKGLHPFRIAFFERDGAQSCELRYQGPGIDKQLVPATALFVATPGE